MDHKEARRRKYGKGITSEYYLRTGTPMEEKKQRDFARDQAIRAAVLAEDENLAAGDERPDNPYQVIFD